MSTLRYVGVDTPRSYGATGPRTAAGRARSSQNARQHGLSSAAGIDLEKVKELSSALAGPGASAERRGHAFAAAYATIDLRRIWALKHRLLAELLDAATSLILFLPHRASEIIDRNRAALAAVARFEFRALARQRVALGRLEVEFYQSLPLGRHSS